MTYEFGAGSLRRLVRRSLGDGCWAMGELDPPMGYRQTPFDRWVSMGGGWHTVDPSDRAPLDAAPQDG